MHTDEGVLYTLRFGEILYGRGDAISAGSESAGDESAGPGENRYLFISAEFDPSVFQAPPKPANKSFEGKEESKMTDEDKTNKKLDEAYKEYEKKVKDAKEKADALAKRFAPWYYVISASSFEKIHLNRGALLKTKDAKAAT